MYFTTSLELDWDGGTVLVLCILNGVKVVSQIVKSLSDFAQVAVEHDQ